MLDEKKSQSCGCSHGRFATGDTVAGAGMGYGDFEDDMDDDDLDAAVEGLMEIGALTEVGAEAVKRKVRAGTPLKVAVRKVVSKGQLPSPNFATTAPSTMRRAPLGFIEDGTNSGGWALAATLGDTTIIRAQVSRPAHINRLLLVASAVGAVITSLKIGDVEQLLNGAVSVELYGTAAHHHAAKHDRRCHHRNGRSEGVRSALSSAAKGLRRGTGVVDRYALPGGCRHPARAGCADDLQRRMAAA